jgi:hypothetical protein
MTMRTQTPIPSWVSTGINTQENGYCSTSIDGLMGGQIDIVARAYGITPEEARWRAEFIALAANSYEALTKALKKSESALREAKYLFKGREHTGFIDEATRESVAALELAGVKP